MNINHLGFSTLAISEVNFLHESSSSSKDHSWFLLLGFKQDQTGEVYIPITDNETNSGWYVEKVIRIPVHANLHIDQESLQRKISLVKVTQKDICVLGVLDLYRADHDEDIENERTGRILTQLTPLSLMYLIKYNPSYAPASSQEFINNLKGFQIENQTQVGTRIILEFLQDKVQINDMNDKYKILIPENDVDLDRDENLISDDTMGLHRDEFKLIDMNEQETNIQEYNNSAIRQLIKRLNRMIKFLENYNIHDNSFSSGRDIILRKISMLITQLQRGGTNDMNYLLDNKINEIRLLEISCKQWEISNALKK
ncbi:hypothetical protein N7582_004336 [Saccharomyces uvarum]|uniref:Uncharacterized protein n=1 Tax=Saccharomyces uvarum TaxID=230603 RepID=A0AA35J5P1_SACUV|nr:hypothetical protein N7582_004336 [Saccharomyces uvarum]CAI4048273.1 hypothetical protein SUVC_13G1620 [Saccharomyces uvarum]